MENDETIVAVYNTAAQADAAIQDLEAANVPFSAISREPSAAQGVSTGSAPPVREHGFWSGLFGGQPDHDTAVYDRNVEGGSHVVTVKVPEARATSIVSILERHNPADIDEPAGKMTTPQPTPGVTPAGVGSAPRAGMHQDEKVIPLAEEQINVGKRLVNRGTTRVRRFVTETPVQENVTLQTEHVSIDRRPVSGDARVTDADFTDKTIEMTESDEEAVVDKTARVREEVVVRKQASERTETISDKVRREDVEITKDGPGYTGAGRGAGSAPPVSR